MKKLRSKSGETLAEMLVSIVILGLSIGLLVTMIMAAGKMTMQVKNRDQQYLYKLGYAETYGNPIMDAPDGVEEGQRKDGTVTISIPDDSSVEPYTVDVKIYSVENELISYKKIKKSGE